MINLQTLLSREYNTWLVISFEPLLETTFQDKKRSVRLNYLAVRRWNSRIHHLEPLLQIKCGQMRVWGWGGSVEEIMARLPAHSHAPQRKQFTKKSLSDGIFHRQTSLCWTRVMDLSVARFPNPTDLSYQLYSRAPLFSDRRAAPSPSPFTTTCYLFDYSWKILITKFTIRFVRGIYWNFKIGPNGLKYIIIM